MAKKVYAIQYGFDFDNNKRIENEIVSTWAECLKYVKGVKGAKYKSFENIDDANVYLNEGNRMLKKCDYTYPKDCLHIYVDGSYNASSSKYSYGVVAVRDNVIEYIESGSGNSNSENNIRQIAGELKGALKALEYAVSKNEKKLVLFHDYEGIAHHATGAWQRKESSSEEYYNNMQKLMNTGIEVIFVKVDSHTGDLFNELVDEKCKECLNITSDKVVEKHLRTNKLYVSDINVKNEVLSIAPNSSNSICIFGEETENNLDINSDNLNNANTKSSVDKGADEKYKFEKILNIYEIDKEQGRKMISKLLSKEKERMIFYLLENKDR
ncbi:MAG: reverse transcriptase-like protein [Clostridium butyricum]|nr:reverse transcriptase-like protein [Clostridium butyricum]